MHCLYDDYIVITSPCMGALKTGRGLKADILSTKKDLCSNDKHVSFILKDEFEHCP